MKKATSIPEDKGSSAQSHGSTVTKPATKIARVLDYVLNIGSLNRFEAFRKVGDSCLHSTVSRLANDHNLMFIRVSERVPNNWGSPCLVTRYSLPRSQRKAARAVLAYLLTHTGERREVA